MILLTLAKRTLFPGLDLHTRSRYRHLPKFFRPGPLETLDVGCGNGALSYAAFNKGNRVTGISLDAGLIAKDADYFGRTVNSDRLRFEVLNAYDLGRLKRKFDQIICSEMLEHVRDDKRILSSLYDALNPGGVLHLCCPNAEHPEHKLGRVDEPEDGGHVRDGYTLASYRTLLEPLGFKIVASAGIGSSPLSAMDLKLRKLRSRGDWLGLPVFLFFLPLAWALDRLNPRVPYSWYVTAEKA